MGQTLSEPVTAKETSSCMNDQVKVGASCMQGWRINMEDAHTHLLSLSEDKDASFFAVYDGHGGAKVAQYAGSHVHHKIVTQPTYREFLLVWLLQCTEVAGLGSPGFFRNDFINDVPPRLFRKGRYSECHQERFP